MTFLLFLGALAAIALFGLIVNRLTGTKPSYLETLILEPGEQELWRDEQADFARRTRLGQARFTSYPRLRRHGIVCTNQRLIVAQKVLFSSKRMITHQVYFERAFDSTSKQAQGASREFSGGFYGRGFETILIKSKTFGELDGKPCLRIEPTDECSAALNLLELFIFSDRLSTLRTALP